MLYVSIYPNSVHVSMHICAQRTRAEKDDRVGNLVQYVCAVDGRRKGVGNLLLESPRWMGGLHMLTFAQLRGSPPLRCAAATTGFM